MDIEPTMSNPGSEQTPTVPSKPSPSGLAIASLVIGILAICLSFLLVGAFFGLIGLVMGIVGLRQNRRRKAMAWWGFSLSLVGLLASLGFGVLYYQVFRQFKAATESARAETPLTQWEGVLAPDFTFTTLDGKQTSLSEFKGKRVVLDFWATWCPPCRREIPHFIHLFNSTSRDDLVIVGISSEEESVIRPFVKQNGMNYPVARTGKLPQPYDSIESIPTTLFIDRHNVIQKVLVGYHDFDQLKSYAQQTDSEGAPKAAPDTTSSGLKESSHPLKSVTAWSVKIPGASALCVGDWDQPGSPEILVADSQRRLHVLGLDGAEKSNLSLPDHFTVIECGRHKDQGPRLLGYSNWGRKVTVMDHQGKSIWSYGSFFGVDGAHWGDLDGDGTDELVAGMNGNGGLHAVTADGKLLWKVSNIGNVWNQAVVPARDGHPSVVLATEAAGSVRVYDAKGSLLHTLRPQGKYCAQMSAASLDKDGTVQVIAIGDGTTVAFDPTGTIAWSTTAIADHTAWRNISFASGDLVGDGHVEWAFLEGSGDLVIATAQGDKLCAIPSQPNIGPFAIATVPNDKGILATLSSDVLTAYRFETAPVITNSP